MGFSSQSVEHVLYLSLACNDILRCISKSSIVVTYPGILLAAVPFARPFYHWKNIRSWLEFRISHTLLWFDNDIWIFLHYTLLITFQSQWFLSIAKQIHQTTFRFMLFSNTIKLYASFALFPIKALSARWMWQKEINIFSIEYDAWVRENFFYVWRMVDLLYLSPHHMSLRWYKLIRSKHLSFTVNVLSNSVGVKSIQLLWQNHYNLYQEVTISSYFLSYWDKKETHGK